MSQDPPTPSHAKSHTATSSAATTGTHANLAITPASIQWQVEGPRAPDFGDRYFHPEDGAGESRYVFLAQNQLPERFSALKAYDTFSIVETGFGTGLNCLEVIALFKKAAPAQARLQIISCDKHPLLKKDLRQASTQWPHLAQAYTELIAHYPPLIRGTHCIRWSDPRIQLQLWWTDINTMLTELVAPVDAWFLDGFAPSRNPEMWSEHLFNHMQRLAKPQQTSFATFTAASAVRRGLAAVGFDVTRAKGYGHKRHMLQGYFEAIPSEASPAATDTNTNTQLKAEHHKSRRKVARKKPLANPPWFEVPVSSALSAPSVATTTTTTTTKPQPPLTLAVVGAGIAGLTTAFLLKEAGYDVTLYDRAHTHTQGGSGNPQAVLYTRLSAIDQAHNRFHNSAFQCAINQLERLQQRPNFEGFTQCGNLEKLKAAQIQQWADDLKHCFLDPDWVTLAAPTDHPLTPTETVLSFPRAGWFSPAILAHSLISLADIPTYFNHQITALNPVSETEDHLASSTSTQPSPNTLHTALNKTRWDICWKNTADNTAGTHSYDGIILCCPDSIAQLCPTFLTHLRPLPGQVNQVPATPLSRSITQVLTGPCSFLPEKDGYHTIGSTYRPQSTDAQIRSTDSEKNHSQLATLTPELAEHYRQHYGEHQQNIHDAPARAATRWNTKDYLPLVGPIPDWAYYTHTYGAMGQLQRRTWSTLPTARYQPNIWVNTGHGSRGFTQSWISAELLLAYISGTQPPLDCATRNALHPARYFMRTLRQKSQSARPKTEPTEKHEK